MKTLGKVLILALLLGTLACTDQKKEDAEMRERVETIEEIDNTVDEINEEIEDDMQELQAALEELDSI